MLSRRTGCGSSVVLERKNRLLGSRLIPGERITRTVRLSLAHHGPRESAHRK